MRRIIIIINILLLVRAMGRHGFPGIVAMVLREASALMRISSIMHGRIGRVWMTLMSL